MAKSSMILTFVVACLTGCSAVPPGVSPYQRAASYSPPSRPTPISVEVIDKPMATSVLYRSSQVRAKALPSGISSARLTLIGRHEKRDGGQSIGVLIEIDHSFTRWLMAGQATFIDIDGRPSEPKSIERVGGDVQCFGSTCAHSEGFVWSVPTDRFGLLTEAGKALNQNWRVAFFAAGQSLEFEVPWALMQRLVDSMPIGVTASKAL